MKKNPDLITFVSREKVKSNQQKFEKLMKRSSLGKILLEEREKIMELTLKGTKKRFIKRSEKGSKKR